MRWAWSSDGGVTFSEPATLFPNVSDGSEGSLSAPNCSHTPGHENTTSCAHLFAEPTLVLGSAKHVYMAASLRQFCLYPYPWQGRRDVLLRRVSISQQKPPELGPIFWLDGIPPGFEAVSERQRIVSLASMDATTQRDFAQLSDANVLPCGPGAKCEACVNGCQQLSTIDPPGPPGLRPPAGQKIGCDIDYEGSGQSWIERTRYSVPASHSDVLLYRSKRVLGGNQSGQFFCFSTRDDPTAAWSQPAPSGTHSGEHTVRAHTVYP